MYKLVRCTEVYNEKGVHDCSSETLQLFQRSWDSLQCSTQAGLVNYKAWLLKPPANMITSEGRNAGWNPWEYDIV